MWRRPRRWLAELVGHQAEIRLQVRAAWLASALGLPGQVVQQTFLVFAALAAALFTKAPLPRGRFRELPVRYGDDTPLGVTRRLLLTGAPAWPRMSSSLASTPSAMS